MEKLLFLLVLISFQSKSQDSLKTELQMILLNSMDSSFVAYGLTTEINFIPNPGFEDENSLVILDSILSKGYRFEYKHPYFGEVYSRDSAYAKPFIKYLSCSEIHDFLNRSGLTFYRLSYGYTTFSNHEELTKKYGFVVSNEGCTMGSSNKEYRSDVEEMLNIRNGIGWYSNYIDDYKKITQEK